MDSSLLSAAEEVYSSFDEFEINVVYSNFDGLQKSKTTHLWLF